MAKPLTVGDLAPNFDLASTEGVVLMLRDEVHRTKVLLYAFRDLETAESHLRQLADQAGRLLAEGIKIMALAETAMAELESIQRQLALPFPLLHDDRGLSQAYLGGQDSAVVLIGREREVEWIESGPSDLSAAVTAVLGGHGGMKGSTANYPGSVINGLVNRWVN